MGQLLLRLPSFLVSLAIVAALSETLLPAAGWPGILLWLASGAMAFHRPTERAIARHLLNLRRPTSQERVRLGPLWREVAARTGVEGRAYELWVEDSGHLNALAAAGHVVGVTRFALENLSDGQLAAVLAHELGHHVRGHAWSSLLGYWYTLPGRLVWGAARVLIRLLLTVNDRERRSGWAALVLLVAGAAVLVLAVHFWFVTLALALVPYLLAAVARRVELRADHHAAAAGFAPMLAEVLHMMQAAERGGVTVPVPALSGCGGSPAADVGAVARGREAGLSEKLLSSHPDYDTRLHHLAPYLERR